jgi:hypothetical protein
MARQVERAILLGRGARKSSRIRKIFGILMKLDDRGVIETSFRFISL